MGKDLAGVDSGSFTKTFHLCPYCFAIQRFSVPCEKDHTGADFLFSGIIQQPFSQLAGNQDRPGLGLAVHNDLTTAHRLHSKEFQFRYPDAGAADGLDHKVKLLLVFGCFQQPQILRLGQLLILGTIGLPLASKILNLAVWPAQEVQQLIDGGQHGIDGTDGIPLFLQGALIGNGVLLSDIQAKRICKKSTCIPQILFYGCCALFLPDQILTKCV